MCAVKNSSKFEAEMLLGVIPWQPPAVQIHNNLAIYPMCVIYGKITCGISVWGEGGVAWLLLLALPVTFIMGNFSFYINLYDHIQTAIAIDIPTLCVVTAYTIIS